MIELTEVPSGDNIATIFADNVGGDAWVGAECWITGWGDDGTIFNYSKFVFQVLCITQRINNIR